MQQQQHGQSQLYTRQEVRNDFTKVPNTYLRRIGRLSGIQVKIIMFVIWKNDFTQPSKEFSVRYVAASIDEKPSTVQVNMTKLIAAGILVVIGRGRRGIRKLEFYNPGTGAAFPELFADRTSGGTDAAQTVHPRVQNRTAHGTEPYTPVYEYQNTQYNINPLQDGRRPELKPQRPGMRHKQNPEGRPTVTKPTDERAGQSDSHKPPIDRLDQKLASRLPEEAREEIRRSFLHNHGDTLVFDARLFPEHLEPVVAYEWPHYRFAGQAAGMGS